MKTIFIIILISTLVIGFSCNITGDCKNYIASQTISPDHQLKIVKFDRNCGATTGNSVQLSVINRLDSLPDDGGNIFIGDSTVGDIFRDTTVKVAWTDNKTIMIIHSKNLRIFKRDSVVSGIKINYQTE